MLPKKKIIAFFRIIPVVNINLKVTGILKGKEKRKEKKRKTEDKLTRT